MRDDQGAFFTQGAIHVVLQEWLSEHQYPLVIYPRDHGKSNQIFPRVLWELGRNPTLRVKIVCQNDEKAQDRLNFLRRHIETNQYLKRIFPQFVPSGYSWSKHALSIKSRTIHIDNTIESYGVLSSATGGRADLLVFDDITDERNSLFSAARRKEVIEAVDNKWLNLVHPQRSRVWWIGTPWHFDDALMRKAQNPDRFQLLRTAIPSDLTPIWPERWDRDALEAKRSEIGTIAFTRGYHCLPISTEEQVFNPEWMRYWYRKDLPEQAQVFVGVDPAFAENAKADDTAIVVVAMADNRYFVLERYRRKGLQLNRLLETLSHINEHYAHWGGIARVGIETVQAQKLIARHVRLNTRFAVKEIATRTNKHARLSILATHFENGRVLLRGNGSNAVHESQRDLYDQLITFPSADHDDLCDGLDFAVQAGQTSKVSFRGWIR